MMFRTRLALAACALFCAAGCGGAPEDDREFAPVSGTVLSKGQPLQADGLQLLFSEGSRPVVLDVSSDGTFSGEVVVGENHVNIQPPEGSGAHGNVEGAPQGGAGGQIQGVHPAYLSGSPLTVMVPEGGVEDVKLEVGEPPAGGAGGAAAGGHGQ